MRLKFRFPIVFKRSVGSLESPNASLVDFFNGGSNSAGTPVNASTSVTLSAVYNSLVILANSVNVPVDVFKELSSGDKEKVGGPVQALLDRPSDEKSFTLWIQLMEMSKNLYGNGYSYIDFSRQGIPRNLTWIHPDFIDVKVDEKTGKRFYDIHNSTGSILMENVPSRKMIHFMAFSFDGYVGKSPIVVAAESLGVALQQQKYGASFFKKGSKNDAVLTYPNALDAPAKAQLKKSLEANRKDGGTLLLEYGLDYKPISIPPDQAQFIESRKFSVNEVARWFNIPPHMLKDLERATFSNIEQQSIEFVTNNVRPRVRDYEQEFNYKLLGTYDNQYTKFNLSALLRADIKSRYESYSIAIQNRWMNVDEVRELENANKLPNGEGQKYENPNITVPDKVDK